MDFHSLKKFFKLALSFPAGTFFTRGEVGARQEAESKVLIMLTVCVAEISP